MVRIDSVVNRRPQRPRRAWWAAIVLGTLAVGLPAAPAVAVTDEEVGEAIDKLTEYLFSQQNADGHWDPQQPEEGDKHTFGLQYGGTTALATYALLSSGQSFQEPRMAKALDALAKFETRGTYMTALRMHVWNQLPDQFIPRMQADLKFLLTCPIETTGGAVAFPYGPGLNDWSNSRTQYGTLGLWEAAKRGLPFSGDVWERLEKHFIQTQVANGAWPYTLDRYEDGTVAMTAAGLTAMYILEDYVHANAYREPGRAANHPARKRIDSGLEYFSKHWKPNTDSPGRGTNFLAYHLYGTERVGLASGRKYFGGQDWFRSGAEVILKGLDKNGAFKVKGAQQHSRDVTRSAFALLFLARGRVPVLASKLEIPDWDWNNRPRDLANLAAWVSDTAEQKMNWQVVSIENRVDDWMDAPILYLAGHKELTLTDEQKAKIKQYIDLGGLLITAADSSSAPFTQSVEKMLNELYPAYQLLPIDPNDELAQMVLPVQPSTLDAKSVHNGARHLAVHLGRRDVSWLWHSRQQSDPAPWQFMLNAYNYATAKGQVRPRLAEHLVQRKAKGGGGPAATVGRARYDGNWNPEPQAWRIQSDKMYNAAKADVTLREVELADLPSPADIPVVHVAGTEAAEPSEAEIESIKKYVDAGGRILFENVGGHGEYLRTIMGALMRAYPGQRFRPLSLESPLITGRGIGGEDASTVRFRPYVILRTGQISTPRFTSLNFDGEPRIILSGDDLSVAMLDQPVWAIYGYSSESAYRLMANFALMGRAGKSKETASRE